MWYYFLIMAGAERRAAIFVSSEAGEEGIPDLLSGVRQTVSSFGIEGFVFVPEKAGEEGELVNPFGARRKLEEQLEEANLAIVDLTSCSPAISVPIGICEEKGVPVVALCSEEVYQKLMRDPLGRTLLGSRSIWKVITYNGNIEVAIKGLSGFLATNKARLGLA